MLEGPSLRLVATPSDSFSTDGDLSNRTQVFAESWARFHSTVLPNIRLSVLECPSEHSGLGVGTQLGLSVAAALHEWTGVEVGGPESFARSVKRGLRSSVGAYGFHRGGLIVERGKADDDWLGPLDLHVELPSTWRFLLVRPSDGETSVAGQKEQQVFDSITGNQDVEQRLESLLRDELAPAALGGDFSTFADSVESYGRLAGSCFSSIQGGPYNGPVLNQLVDAMKQLGAQGVGQSSWGPTLFACFANEASAKECEAKVSKLSEFGSLVTTNLSAASPSGAIVSVTRK